MTEVAGTVCNYHVDGAHRIGPDGVSCLCGSRAPARRLLVEAAKTSEPNSAQSVSNRLAFLASVIKEDDPYGSAVFAAAVDELWAEGRERSPLLVAVIAQADALWAMTWRDMYANPGRRANAVARHPSRTGSPDASLAMLQAEQLTDASLVALRDQTD